jgi:hypothetical protein
VAKTPPTATADRGLASQFLSSSRPILPIDDARECEQPGCGSHFGRLILSSEPAEKRYGVVSGDQRGGQDRARDSELGEEQF